MPTLINPTPLDRYHGLINKQVIDPDPMQLSAAQILTRLYNDVLAYEEQRQGWKQKVLYMMIKKMYAEPDEGTIMIWISDLSETLLTKVKSILSEYNDELEDEEEDDEYKYVVDCSINSYDKIRYLLETNDYIYSGLWEDSP